MPVLEAGEASLKVQEKNGRDASQFVGMAFIIAAELLWTPLWLATKDISLTLAVLMVSGLL